MSDKDQQPKKSEREKATEYVRSKMDSAAKELQNKELQNKLLETLDHSFTHGHPAEEVSSSSSAETKLQRTKSLHKKLAETLGYSSFALQLAVAYIKYANESPDESGGQRFGIEEYLELYEKKRGDAASLDLAENLKTDVATLALLVTLDALEKKKEGKEAKEICHLLAHMTPSSSIPLDLLDNLDMGNSIDQSVVQGAVKLVGYFAIFIIDKDDRTIQTEHTVQQLVKNVVLLPEDRMLEMGLKLFAGAVLDEFIAPHAFSVWKCSSKYPALIKKYHNLVIKILSKLHGSRDEIIKLADEQKKLLSNNLSADNLDLMTLEDALYMIGLNNNLYLFRDILKRGGVRCGYAYYTLEYRFRRADELLKEGKIREVHDMFKNFHGAVAVEGSDVERAIILTLEGLLMIWKYELDELCAHDCAEKLKSIIKDVGKSTGEQYDFTPYLKAKAAMVLFEGGEHDLSAELLMEIRQVGDYRWGKDSSLLKSVI